MGIFEFIYFLGYSLKKYYYLRHQKHLPSKVISIGNITAGGTGKTPAVMALATEILKRGLVPCILTRGYRGKVKGPCFVSMGEGPLFNEKDSGDEPFLMANKLKGAIIVKGADRHKAGMFAVKELSTDNHEITTKMLFILDDGFQHWRLFRDKNILLIDAENPFDNKKLLPVGLLREPLKEIRRADIVVITKASGLNEIEKLETENLIREIKRYNPRVLIFQSGHKPLRFVGPSGETMPLRWAGGKNFFAFCGIGNPESLRRTLIITGCELKGLRVYSDHYRYKQNDIENILKESQKVNADWIVTTEKDMMRLKDLTLPDNVISLAIGFEVDQRFYDKVLD